MRCSSVHRGMAGGVPRTCRRRRRFTVIIGPGPATGAIIIIIKTEINLNIYGGLETPSAARPRRDRRV